MHPAILGALWGLGVGVALVVFEYVLLSKDVTERAKKLNRAAVFEQTERRRMNSMIRFAVILPFAFAIAFWLIFD